MLFHWNIPYVKDCPSWNTVSKEHSCSLCTVLLDLGYFYSSFMLFLINLNVSVIKSRVICEEKPRSDYEHVLGGLSWLLIDVGWSSSWWEAPFPRQEVLGCLSILAKWMSEPESSIFHGCCYSFCLLYCPDFPQWQTVTWMCKPVMSVTATERKLNDHSEASQDHLWLT